jgi:hypothetical protein
MGRQDSESSSAILAPAPARETGCVDLSDLVEINPAVA